MFCVEYSDSADPDDARASCEANGGTWADAPCDEAGAIARCDAFGSASWYYSTYLTATGATLDDLRQSCDELGGDFTEL